MQSKNKREALVFLGSLLVCLSIFGFVYASDSVSFAEPAPVFVSHSYTQTVDGELVVFNEVCQVGVDVECVP